MKRLITLFLTVVLVFTCLTACRSGQTGEESTAANPESTAAPTTVTGETVNPTLPDIEMPSQPDADYQLPPYENPGAENVQTQ